MKKEKVVIFGIGSGAEKYIVKHVNEIEIIACIDNDPTKHNTSFLDKFQIQPPSELQHITFDKIIITSQWAKDIYTQLVESLNVKPEKICIPAKKMIKEANKPFEDKKTRELGREIIRHMTRCAIQDKVPLVIDFGTLLGLVRDGDIIEWDDDIDFSLQLDTQTDELSKWVSQSISKIDFPVNFKIINNKNINFIIDFENIDKEHYYEPFSTSISFRKNKEDNSIHLPSGGMWYAPKKHFERYETINWQGVPIMVPFNYLEYLTFLYGDWKTPKKDITMADYAHLGNVDYKAFKDLGSGYKEVK